MNLQSLRSFRITLLSFLILLGVGVFPVLAHDGGEGTADTTARTLTTTQLYLVGNAQVTLGTSHSHVCNVTASARMQALSNAAGQYFFVLKKYTQGTNVGGSRTVQFAGQETIKSVSSNFSFKGLTGTVTFVFTAQKAAATAPNLYIDSNSMTVNCFDTVF